MRKLIVISLILALFLGISTPYSYKTSAKSSSGTAKPYPVTVKISGKTFKAIGSKARIKNSLVYLPIQLVAKESGYKTSVSSKKIVFTKGSVKVEFTFSTGALKTSQKTIKLKSKTFKSSKYTYVTFTFIKKALNATCDWFAATKTAVIYTMDNGPKSLYQRLHDSGEYKLYPEDFPVPYKFGCALLNKNPKFNYSISVDMSDPKDCRYDLHIKIRKYDKPTREKIREILKLAYPYKNKEVFRLFIATIREEIYKNSWDTANHPGISYVYYEGRLFNVYKQLENTNLVYIKIGVKSRNYLKPVDSDNQIDPSHSDKSELKATIKKYSIYYDKK